MMKTLRCVLAYLICLGLLAACGGVTPLHSDSAKKTDEKTQIEIPGIDNTASVTVPLKPDGTPVVATHREPVVALILGPGLNRSAAHISFLRILEQRGIKIHMIEGQEMGAIVAALYARYQSAERVEWFFYKYFRKNERADLFSSSWKKLIEEELLGSFGKDACSGLNIESLKMELLIPLYSSKERKVNYLRRGNLCSALMSTVTTSLEAQELSGAYEWSLYNSSALKKAGADLVIGVDVLGSKVVFRKENAKIKALYEKVLKIRNIEKNYVDYFVSLPAEEMPMDGLENLPLISKKSLLTSDKAAKEILEKIKKWKEKHP